jgi:carbon-monoxide dehydrogenase medium subunit
LDLFTTAVGRDEILTEIRLPYLPRGSASAFMKHAVRHEGFAIAMVGVTLTFDDGSVCTEARIGVGAAGPTPLRAASAEDYLTGKAVDEAVMAEAAVRTAQEADPPQDVHGSREYRLGVIEALVKSSLRLAVHRSDMRGSK